MSFKKGDKVLSKYDEGVFRYMGLCDCASHCTLHRIQNMRGVIRYVYLRNLSRPLGQLEFSFMKG